MNFNVLSTDLGFAAFMKLSHRLRFRKQNCLTDIFVCKHQEKVIFVASISESESMVTVSLVFTLIGKMAITGSFSTIFLFTPELYPTNLRYVSTGLLVSCICSLRG